MNTLRKRQKVSSACERCRQRKLGCDTQRPCQSCTRAAAECVPRHLGTIGPVSAGEERGSFRIDQIDDFGTTNTVVLPESSIVDLSRMIFLRTGHDQNLAHDTSALPGGNKLPERTVASMKPWRSLVGIPLPADDVLDDIIANFFLSVDWFMMVFQEDHFRRKYAELLNSQQTTCRDSNFLWICMLVIALGAHYSAATPFPNQNNIDYRRLSQDLFARIEANFLQIVGCSTLETIQTCILLGSFFLFNGRPNAGLGISGSGVKIAQVIGLHRESLWKDDSQAVREEKRRTWWALEVFDKYAAIAFGRPCIIDDSDCDVSMVSEVGPTGQVNGRNPLLMYHQWKFRLYRIMGPFLGRRRQLNRLETVHIIHGQLVQWRKELPDRLRLEKYDENSEQISLLQMQALNLQLTYDNLQIILHRTTAFNYDDEAGKLGMASPESNASVQQLLVSAMNTSELYRYSPVLRASRRTHADMHIGITLFTAGVVLCAICLSQPMTETGSRAKTGVMHIIRMCRNASSTSQHLISSQSLQILDSLVTAVLQLENSLITGRLDPAVTSPGRHGAVLNATSSIGTDAIGAHSTDLELNVIAKRGERLLHPIQEVFAHHMSRSTPIPLPAMSVDTAELMEPGIETSDPSAEDAAGAFVWDGDLSFLVDSGLGDASQLWLWTNNQNFDSFNNLYD